MLVLLHVRCGKPAIGITRRIEYGERVSHDQFLHLDGTPVKAFEPRRCESCGELYGLATLRSGDIVETEEATTPGTP